MFARKAFQTLLTAASLTAFAACSAAGQPRDALCNGSFLNPDLSQAMVQHGLSDLFAAIDPTVVYIEAASVPVSPKGHRKTRPAPQPSESAGTGFVIRQENETSYILTNWHVVDDSTALRVTLADGRRFKAETVAHDSFTDVAIIKISASGLPVATLGDSADLRVGDPAIIIGNPYSYRHSLTVGIISGLGGPERYLSNVQVIQVSAAVNFGNSGGPLLDSCGRVLGIVTLKGRGEALGYAVPVDLVKDVTEQLFAKGFAEHTFAGIKTGVRKARPQDLPADETVVINEVLPDTPAQKAGLKKGDLIVKLGEQEIVAHSDVARIIVAHKGGDQLVFSVLRAGKPLQFTVTLGAISAEKPNH